MMDERQTEYELDDEVPILDDSPVLDDDLVLASDDAVLEAKLPSVPVLELDDAALERRLVPVLELDVDRLLVQKEQLVLKAALSLDLELVLKEERFSVRDQVRDRQVAAGLQDEIQ